MQNLGVSWNEFPERIPCTSERSGRFFEKVRAEERSFEKLSAEERKHILQTVDRKVAMFGRGREI